MALGEATREEARDLIGALAAARVSRGSVEAGLKEGEGSARGDESGLQQRRAGATRRRDHDPRGEGGGPLLGALRRHTTLLTRISLLRENTINSIFL